jgi:hypothetical protein
MGCGHLVRLAAYEEQRKEEGYEERVAKRHGNGKWGMRNEKLGINIPLLFQKGWPKAGVVIWS